LQRREKHRQSKNNGKQWKNNAKNNGSNEKGSCNLIEIIDIRLNHFRRRAEQTQFRPILLSALCFQAARRRKLPRSQPDPWFRVSPQGVQSTRALQPPVKYRRFTGRRMRVECRKSH
jgi:hypothetical protein